MWKAALVEHTEFDATKTRGWGVKDKDGASGLGVRDSDTRAWKGVGM